MELMVLFGGRSFEHDVSLMSARSIMENLAGSGHRLFPVGITKEGEWVTVFEHEGLTPEKIIERGEVRVLLSFGPDWRGVYLKEQDFIFKPIDLVFPVLHGPFGEDGTLQGMLEMAGLPYTGSGVSGSCIGMDKDLMKRLFARNKIPQTEFITVRRREWNTSPEEVEQRVVEGVGFPCFVKPSNSGSSVGITRVRGEEGLPHALKEAFRYDVKCVVERGVKGREIECSVLGNDLPAASVPGEVIPCREFYDYEAKYILSDSKLVIPADLPEDVVEMVQELAIKAFTTIEARGYARVDLFYDEGGRVLVNEINTIPGFTTISMFPKLWEASGIPYRELLSRIIDLALEEHELKKGLKRGYSP